MTSSFAKHGITHLSPSQINLFSASPAMWVMEKLLGHRQQGSAPMYAGTAAEAGIVAGLLDPKKELEACIEVTQKKFKELTLTSSDPRVAKYIEALPGMVTYGLAHLRPYGVPSRTQGKVEYQPEGLGVPIMGYYDFLWEDRGVLIDLKTTLRMPSEIKLAHARQVAFYKHAISDNLDGLVTYVTDKKVETYRVEDTRRHRDAFVKISLIMQRFLALSDDARELTQLVCPDYDSFYFNDASARRAALNTWGF